MLLWGVTRVKRWMPSDVFLKKTLNGEVRDIELVMTKVDSSGSQRCKASK